MTANLVSEVIRVWDRGVGDELEKFLTDPFLQKSSFMFGRRLAEKIATRFVNGEITLETIEAKARDEDVRQDIRDVYYFVESIIDGKYDK